MTLSHKQLGQSPIDLGGILKNRVMTFGDGRLTVVELRTKDDLVGIGQCRRSDQDLRNPSFKPD